MVRILIRNNTGAQRYEVFEKRESLVGSDSKNDIVLSGDNILALHASILILNGRIIITSLDKTNIVRNVFKQQKSLASPFVPSRTSMDFSQRMTTSHP
jgi:hypothetical protein